MEPVSQAVSMIPGVMRALLGQAQFFGGLLMKPKRPKYEIPGEIQEVAESARLMRYGRSPGLGLAEDRLAQSGANQLAGLRRGATSSTQLLSGLSSIELNSNIARRGLMEADASDFYRRDQIYRSSLGLMGQFKDKQWDYNVNQPYQDKARTKAALLGSGLKNWFGGADDAALGYMNQQYLDNMSGNKQGQRKTIPDSWFGNESLSSTSEMGSYG